MPKELKHIICRQLESQLGDLDGCVLVDYRGLNSEQTQDLRASLRKSNVRMTVVRNRLARRVFAEQGAPDGFRQLFQGPTAILYGPGGALDASKSISQWRKKNSNLAPIKGGLFQGEALSIEQVETLAAIPDKETLQAQICASLVSPMACLANAARSLLSHFAGCVKARKEELEQGGGASGGDAAS